MGTVLNTRLLVRNRDGLLVEYKEPYASIECETEEDFKLIQTAMEKQTPKDPILQRHVKTVQAVDRIDGTGELQEKEGNYWCCACCGFIVGERKTFLNHNVDFRKKNFCDNCGQKINWSNEKNDALSQKIKDWLQTGMYK